MNISYIFAIEILNVLFICYQLTFNIFQIIMKTKKIIIGMLLGLIAVPAISQNVETDADSLQQVVDEISEKNKQLEAETLNKKIWNDRAKYFNISYVKQSLSTEDSNLEYNSSLGVAVTNGRTYYLHKKPILGMIKFGIDWSYFDVNFAMYENETNSGYEKEKVSTYQAEIGMQIGPSVTVNPIDHLKVNGYFRVTPSYSMMYADEEFNGSYGTFFSAGGAISYKVISIGIESRWGKTKYKSLVDIGEFMGEDEGMSSEGGTTKSTWKTNSTRFYISFRF